MAAKQISSDFATLIPVRTPIGILRTDTLFDDNHDDSDISAIDQFIENTLRLNKMWVKLPNENHIETELGILLILGYISAIESFMRALIRRVIFVDIYSQRACEKATLSYGAAQYQSSKMLPEALLEESMFSSKKGILDGLRKFLGFELKDKGITDLLDQFHIVCELRHCCVHRFGKLGTKNAIELGLNNHKKSIEKPLRLGSNDVAIIADLITCVAKALNNEVFRFILERSVTGVNISNGTKKGVGWTWHKAKDRRLYAKYYNVFASRLDSTPTPPENEFYERFRKIYRQTKQNKN